MMRIIAVTFAILMTHRHELFAQAPVRPNVAPQQVIQQPIVRQFGVTTSVSVPDRGRALLGGVNRGAIGRKTYGPLRSGTSSGAEYSSASQSASVYIFDFDAMDQALLDAADREAPTSSRGNRTSSAARSSKAKINSRAEQAWHSFQARQQKHP